MSILEVFVTAIFFALLMVLIIDGIKWKRKQRDRF